MDIASAYGTVVGQRKIPGSTPGKLDIIFSPFPSCLYSPPTKLRMEKRGGKGERFLKDMNNDKRNYVFLFLIDFSEGLKTY